MESKLSAEIIGKIKGQGFILNKGGETFSVRVPTGNGTVSCDEMNAVSEAARRFGDGRVGLTSRQTFEISGVPYENTEPLRAFLADNGLEPGGTGPKVRPITSCKGTLCQFGRYDTFGFATKLHEIFYIGWHGVALPSKFKMGVGGCPNNCVKPQLNDIGFMGSGSGDKCIKIFVGGKYGRTWRQGTPLEGLYSADEAIAITGRALNYYKDNASPKERFGDMIDRIGFETVQNALLNRV